jgi:hypothetical protein
MAFFSPASIVYTTNLPGSVHEMAAIDLNGDGRLDIISGRFYSPAQNASIPLEVLINNGNGSFSNGANSSVPGGVPSTTHPREFVTADFNGDGKLDLFIADHGYDAAPFPGAQNRLLLSSGATYVDATNSNLPAIIDFTHSAAAGDIDHDGDIDIYVGNLYGQGQVPPYFLINNGAGIFTRVDNLLPPAIVDLNQNKWVTSELGDLNHDGFPDLFLGSDVGNSSAIVWNDGTGHFVNPSSLPSEPFGPSSIALDSHILDLNGDGLNDLVVVFTRSDYTDRAVTVWMNHGGGNFVDETSERINYVTQTGGWIKYVNFADFNGDGALDFITEPAGGSSEVLINNGDGFFFRPTDAVQTFTGVAFEVGDFTGDGRPDVAAWGGSNLLLFALQDGPTYPFIGDAGDNSIYGDANGNSLDGRGGADTLRAGSGNDLLNGGAGADSLFGGTGADKFVFDAVALTDAQSAIFDRVRDYDQGGGGAYNSGEGDQIDLTALLSTAYNHGSGQPVASLVRAIEDSSGTFANLQIDTDGTANGANWLTIARLDGIQPHNTLNIILDSASPGGSAISVSNAPGTPIFGAATFQLAAFGPGAGGWTDQQHYPRLVADVNGDKMADIVGFSAGGVSVSLATGSGHFAAPTGELGSFGSSAGGWTTEDRYPRLLGDVNGDGMADIVGFADGGVSVSLATGNGHFAAPTGEIGYFGFTAGGWTSEDRYPRLLGDVNGDGKADIVGFADGGVLVALATSNGHFATPTGEIGSFGFSAGGWTSEDRYPRLLADVNGDGMADIVGFADGGVLVSLATGNGHFAAPTGEIGYFGFTAGGWTSEDHYPRLLADVSGDGMADIVGFGSGGVSVSLATGNGHFAAPTSEIGSFGATAGGWSSQDLYPRTLGDVNGDGAADIIGFGQSGVYDALSNGFHLV